MSDIMWPAIVVVTNLLMLWIGFYLGDEAHHEVEALDIRTGVWRSLPPLIRARHGSGLIFHQGSLFIASGSGARGGRPELTTMERLDWGGLVKSPEE